jgi:hypothetical protein
VRRCDNIQDKAIALCSHGGAAQGAYIIHTPVVLGVQAGMDAVSLAPFITFIIATIVAALLSFGISYLAKTLPGLKRLLSAASRMIGGCAAEVVHAQDRGPRAIGHQGSRRGAQQMMMKDQD